MRLTACLLTIATVAAARNESVRSLNGVWVSGAAWCGIKASPVCSRVLLDITQEGNRLKVVEVASVEGATSVSERLYWFSKGPLRRFGGDVGTAEITGRSTVLRCSDRLERWRLSEDGTKLIVNRSISQDAKGPQRVFIFQRSETVD